MPLIAQSSAEVFTITDMNGELDNQPWTIWGGFGLEKLDVYLFYDTRWYLHF